MRKLALLVVSVGLVAVLLTGAAAATLTTPAAAGGLNRDADIPAELVPIIEAAAGAYCDLRPALLAAILKVESDFGRSPLPGVRSGANDVRLYLVDGPASAPVLHPMTMVARS